ncbi:MAG TPA: AraC family transcriptional regulator [Chryseolinea sp.]|nr:AraC family transcriptional regulator [Chryseolinea sp.]
MLTKTIVLIISCLGLIQAILLCVYLFSLKDKRANIFLALMLLALIIRVGKSIFNNYMPLEPWIRNLGISGILMTGPFLWFYGKALFEKKNFSNRNYLHLIPFVLFVLLCWIIPNKADFASLFIYSLVLLHLAVYLIVCWAYIIRVLKDARLLPWYRNIVSGVTLIWFLYVGIFIGFIPLYILGAVIFSFLIYIFSYLLLKRHVFALEKYSNSTISQDTSKRLLQQVKELFETKELYLDSTISLKVVAENLSTSPRELSQVINENAQMNFSEFVNHYRIAKAKSLLADPNYLQEKIETIAYDCGFGNVTSFNLAFKAETKVTPSQYRNQVSIA